MSKRQKSTRKLFRSWKYGNKECLVVQNGTKKTKDKTKNKTKKKQRICKFCDLDEVGVETHFLLQCRNHKDLWTGLIYLH